MSGPSRQGLRPSARPLLAALVALVAALVGALALAPSTAAAGGTVTGKVTDAHGNPIQGVHVVVGSFSHNGHADTDATGRYSVTGIPAGTYTVYFEHTARDYAPQYYPNAARRNDAGQVDVAGSATLTDMDATLVVGAVIRGTVTDEHGTPVRGVDIDVRYGDGEFSADGARTDSNGRYQVRALAADSYVVRFDPPWDSGYQREYYDDARYPDEATPVVLTAGEVRTGVDAALHCPDTCTPGTGPEPEPLDLDLAPARATGTAKVGQVLTTTGATSPATPTLSYQWRRNGSPIKDATYKTYKLVRADAGTNVSVTVTGTRPGFATSSVTSPARAVAAFNLRRPAITGTTRVGKKLTAARGTWVAPGHTFTYQWLRGGKPVRGATRATYKLTKADKGKRIAVKVTVRRSGFPTVAATSPARTVR